MKKILIIDDHYVVRAGTTLILQTHFNDLHIDHASCYQDAIDKNKKEGRLVIEDNFLKATKEGLYVLNDILVDFMK